MQVARVRTGVRALPQTTIDGAIPLAGRLPSTPQHSKYALPSALGTRCYNKQDNCPVHLAAFLLRTAMLGVLACKIAMLQR